MLSIKISILTPVRDEEFYLEEMIASVRRQSYPNWELIIIDDGSRDRTASIAAKAAAVDSRIRFPASDRVGKIAAFNAAFTHATGDAVMATAGDDVLPLRSLEARARSLEGYLGNDKVFAVGRLVQFERRRGVTRTSSAQSSLSFPALTLTRALAEMAFPIPAEVVADDPWVSVVCRAFATVRVDLDSTVVLHRIHSGNTGPSTKSFAEMSSGIHSRSEAYRVIESLGEALHPDLIHHFRSRYKAEQLRYRGDWFRILRLSELPLRERLGLAARSRPFLYHVHLALTRHLAMAHAVWDRSAP